MCVVCCSVRQTNDTRMHVKTTHSFLQCTPNLLHRYTKIEIGVSIEQIWCAGHTTVFTVYVIMYLSHYMHIHACQLHPKIDNLVNYKLVWSKMRFLLLFVLTVYWIPCTSAQTPPPGEFAQ